MVAQWGSCGGSLGELWWVFGVILVGLWGSCGGSFGELWWVFGGVVVGHWGVVVGQCAAGSYCRI